MNVAQISKTALVAMIFQLTLSSHALTGGISGGGGYVINPEKPIEKQDPDCVEQLIEKSRYTLDQYVHAKKVQLDSGNLNDSEKQLLEKLFKKPTTNLDIHEAIHKYGVYIDESQPCFTSDRQPVDGSIYSQEPNTICISSATMAEKVAKHEIPKQAAALMLHEYSEVVGLTDDEAILLQKKALEELK